MPTLPANIPIIGAAPTVEACVAQVSVVIRCLCAPSNKLVLIPSTDFQAECQACGRRYAIVKVEFDRQRNHAVPNIYVAAVGRTTRAESLS